MIITALLRTYGGLFTDYVYISENLIAQMCDISVQQVYMTLKNLSSRHIVDFIPQRKTPYITYTRQREDGNRIIIPKSVWEDRKEQYTKRIKSVITYANNDIVCRSDNFYATSVKKPEKTVDIVMFARKTVNPAI